MKVEIISINSKLLMGDILDTNTAYITRNLRAINAQLIAKTIVGSDLDMITEAFRTGLNRADVVIAIGGLGNEPTDFTRLAAAQATNRELIPQSPGIKGARLLGGSDVRLQGFLIETEQGKLICLPGRRREMGFILDTEALPYLQQQIPAPTTRVGWVLLRTVGIMESSLKQKLLDLAEDAHHRITYDSFAGQTNIQLWVEAGSQEQIDRELAAMKQLVSERLGDHIYGEGEDRLEDVVLGALVRGGRKLAVAECYTEQTLSRLLTKTNVPDGTVQLLPTATWEDLQAVVKLDDLTPEDDLTRWCRVAAEQLLEYAESGLGLLVYKNVTQGGVQVLVTLASQMGVSVTQRSFGGHPEHIDQWAATLGLSHLRRWLLAHQQA
jgi:nicotinamide-nucleotide amidase